MKARLQRMWKRLTDGYWAVWFRRASARVEWESFGGNCPVQAEGTVNGIPFYFRARGEWWTFGIGDDPVGITMGEAEGFYRECHYSPGDTYAAGWMPQDEAKAAIRRCILEYLRERQALAAARGEG